MQDSTTRLTLTRAALDRASLLAEIRALHGEPPGGRSRCLVRATGSCGWPASCRSGRPDRIRGALASMESPDPELTPLLIGLLARDDVFHAVLRSLRGVALRTTGQLVDALLDPDQPAAVRRRIPRVLKACPTARAVEGLLLGLGDPDFVVRRECGLVLAWLRERHAVLVLPAPLHAAVARELATSSADADAQLDHVFVLLSAVGEREPLRASHQALRGDDVRLRGTALEYLEQVLPEVVRHPLLRRLGTAHQPPSSVGAAEPAARPPRQLDEVEEELQGAPPSRALAAPSPAVRARGPDHRIER